MRHIEGVTLGSLGILLIEQGRMDEAREHFEAALAIHTELKERRHVGIFTEYLGSAAMDQSHMEEARGKLAAALAIHREVGDALASSESILRRINARNELGKLLCMRATLELRRGDVAAVGLALAEARAIGDQIGAGPDSELGRMLAKASHELDLLAR